MSIQATSRPGLPLRTSGTSTLPLGPDSEAQGRRGSGPSAEPELIVRRTSEYAKASQGGREVCVRGQKTLDYYSGNVKGTSITSFEGVFVA